MAITATVSLIDPALPVAGSDGAVLGGAAGSDGAVLAGAVVPDPEPAPPEVGLGRSQCSPRSAVIAHIHGKACERMRLLGGRGRWEDRYEGVAA
jgi:hypothetical protein